MLRYQFFPTHDAEGHSEQEAGRPRPAARPTARDADLLDAYSQAVIHVVETVSPAVISITGRDANGRGGSGSGFIVTPDGYAITNSHVIDDRLQLEAETTDGDRLRAELVGDDPATDLAIVRLSSNGLPFAKLGDSEALRVGQLVIAMGSPLGLQSTVSTGVVSALGRSMRARDGRLIENIVQHAAPINPGNSGGPMFNMAGEVIGMNTAIYSPVGASVGIGFATPAELIAPVIAELRANGRIARGWLGVAAEPIPQAQREQQQNGVRIAQVNPNGPAARAGLRQGDIVTAVNDVAIDSPRALARSVAQLAPGTAAKLSVVRQGRPQEITVPLGTRPNNPQG